MSVLWTVLELRQRLAIRVLKDESTKYPRAPLGHKKKPPPARWFFGWGYVDNLWIDVWGTRVCTVYMKALSYTCSFVVAVALLLLASFLLLPVSVHALSMVAPNPVYYQGNYYNNAWQCAGSCYGGGYSQDYYNQYYPQQYYYPQYYPVYYPQYYPEYYPVYYYEQPYAYTQQYYYDWYQPYYYY